MAGLLSAGPARRLHPAEAAGEGRARPFEAHDEGGPRSSEAYGEGGNVTPEEQAEYDRFVLGGMSLIYEGGKVRPGILELLDEDPADLIAILGDVGELKHFSPVAALAATTVVLVLELIRRSGDRMPEDAIVLHGGKALLEELAYLAGEAGLHDYGQNELNRAFLIGMDLWRESASTAGLIDTDKLKAEFAEIKAADAEGRLGALLDAGAARPPKPEAKPARPPKPKGKARRRR